MRLLPYGEDAVLAELDDPDSVPAVRATLAALDGVVDAIAGARTVLAVHDPGAGERVRAAFEGALTSARTPPAAADLVEIPVEYDGADLAEVAVETGLDPAEVIARHRGGAYVVRFCGFSPGFAYLDGLDPALHLPRRREPRTSVPAGSVAIAGEFTGVYPQSSPGGWRLLGHTDLDLWDVGRVPPALLIPGTRVRFVMP